VLKPGDILEGTSSQYTIEDLFGGRSQHPTYIGRSRDGREVFIKVGPREDLRREPELEAHRQRNFRSHTSVFGKVLDWGPIGDDFYFNVSAFQGRNLREFATEGHSHDQVCDVLRLTVRSVLALFARARTRGDEIIHGDIKPANCLVVDTQDGRDVLIIDFETAQRASEDASNDGQWVTPTFCAWEGLLYNKEPSRSRDWWAVGASVLCILLDKLHPDHTGEEQLEHLKPSGRKLDRLAQDRHLLDDDGKSELDRLSHLVHSDPDQLIELDMLQPLSLQERQGLMARFPGQRGMDLIRALSRAMSPRPDRRRLEPLLEVLTRLAGGHPRIQELPCDLDRFRLLDPVGHGGFGVVYRALDTEMEDVAAVKVLLEDAPVRGETEALSLLRHRNVVRVLGTGEAKGLRYVAMELLHGANLKGAGPIRRDLLADTALQISAGLAYVHDRGLIHRDVKPSNLFRTVDGTIKLLDFGLSKSVEDGDASNSGLRGTFPYMAPEQLREGDNVSPATDVYAAGLTLYELTLGERLERRAAIDSCEVRARLDEHAPGLAPVLSRCLRERPQERYADGNALHAALLELQALPTRRVDPEPFNFDPPPSGPRVIDWVRPRQADSVAIVRTLALVAAALFVVLWSMS